MYGVWQAVVWGLVRIGHRSNGGITDFMVEIYKLPPESAKATAEDLLRDESRFICIRAEEDLPDNIAALGGCVADLFARYQGIKRVGGDAILGWDQVGESEYLKGFVRIGIDTDFVEYAARPNIHGVYELDGSDQSIQDVGPPAYPSVYHLILMIDRSYSGK